MTTLSGRCYQIVMSLVAPRHHRLSTSTPTGFETRERSEPLSTAGALGRPQGGIPRPRGGVSGTVGRRGGVRPSTGRLGRVGGTRSCPTAVPSLHPGPGPTSARPLPPPALPRPCSLPCAPSRRSCPAPFWGVAGVSSGRAGVSDGTLQHSQDSHMFECLCWWGRCAVRAGAPIAPFLRVS